MSDKPAEYYQEWADRLNASPQWRRWARENGIDYTLTPKLLADVEEQIILDEIAEASEDDDPGEGTPANTP